MAEPWTEPERNWTIHTNLDVKKDIPAIKHRVQSINADVNIYTDGSCTGGVSNGGASAVITTGCFDEPTVIATKKAIGEARICSYKEEARAMALGIDWLEENARLQSCAILTDSLSLLQALDNDKPDTAEIRARLQQACNKIDLLYVPGHKDIPGNELADTLDEPFLNKPLHFTTARALIKSEIKDNPTQHHLGGKFYHLVSQDRDNTETKTRKQGALLSQLRSGHHISLNYYKHLVDESITDKCQRCLSGEVDTTEHWFTECSQTEAARQAIFGTHEISLAEMALAPGKTIELAEKTLPL
jgi:ribonuclease HI